MTYSTCEATDMRAVATGNAELFSTRKVSVLSVVPPVPAPDGEATVRRRARAGSIVIEHRSFPRQHSLSARIKPGAVVLLVPSSGRVTVVTDGNSLTVEPGQVALLARPQDGTLVWSAGACGDILHIRRDLVQICASRYFSEPRRLGAADTRIAADRPFMEALAALMASALPVKPAIESVPSDGDADFHLALVALAERHDLADALFVDVRSAREAMAYVRANHHRDCSPAALAAIAGVTERTLRERFRQCLGVSIAAFVQDVRLDWAYARLTTARESRSIHDLARAAGFNTAGAFSKSYLRRFGESATQTRARAVQEAEAV